MTLSAINLHATAEDHRIARMAAIAIGLSVLEAGVPSPLPGVKPGLANIITLVVLQRDGVGAAISVALLRVMAGSLILGSFLSPSFVLSLSGALCSLAILAVAVHLPKAYFGAISQSILASFAHIAGQLLVVYLWLIPHVGLLYLVPVFATAALLFGLVNGVIAARLGADNPPAPDAPAFEPA